MKIGILGGGQLAKMIIEENSKFGFAFKIFSEFPNSPAGMICKEEVVGEFRDLDKLKEFADDCDIITLENEFIDSKYLKYIESLNKKIYPTSKIIAMIQDKLTQKINLQNLGIPIADFSEVNSIEDINQFISFHKYPVILKSRTMGYDGKGNFKIDDESQIENAYQILSQRGKLMCESFVDFKRELAIQIVRNISGEKVIYQVVETIQKNHICKLVKASKSFNNKISQQIKGIAEKIIDSFDYVGVLAIELFQMDNNDILVNELAPRVHNSGHYTIEGCVTSQFENHIRAILNFPLGSTEMYSENAVMLNIIGDRNAKSHLQNYEPVLKGEKTFLHIYGKEETKIGRKMGHITMLGNEMSSLLFKASEIDNNLKI